MSNTKYPRILLVNNSSRLTKNATGITLNSIFSNWPTCNVLEISCSANAEDGEINGSQVYAIDRKYYPAFFIMRSNFFKKINGVSKRDIISNNSIKNNQSKLKDIVGKIKKDIRKILIAYMDIMPLFTPHELNHIILKYNPDYIYTMGGSIISMKLALYFANNLNKPIIIHFMDNWQDTLYNDTLITKPCHIIAKKLLKKIYSKTKVALTISNNMAQEYSDRWGVKHLPLMNTVNEISDEPNVLNSKLITITYTGGLHLSRWESLLELSDVLKEYIYKYEIGITLKIYTSEKDKNSYEHFFNEEFVVFKDYVDHSRIRDVYQESDILVHIESFNPELKDFTKYSLSTKIPEYMASGKPLLVYAPEGYAVSSYIRNYDAGLVINDKSELRDRLIELITNYDMRYKLANNAIKLVKNNHTVSEGHNILKKAFN